MVSRRRACPALVRRVLAAGSDAARCTQQARAAMSDRSDWCTPARIQARAPRARRPRRAASALTAPLCAAPQELAKQADPNLTLDNEAQQAR